MGRSCIPQEVGSRDTATPQWPEMRNCRELTPQPCPHPSCSSLAGASHSPSTTRSSRHWEPWCHPCRPVPRAQSGVEKQGEDLYTSPASLPSAPALVSSFSHWAPQLRVVPTFTALLCPSHPPGPMHTHACWTVLSSPDCLPHLIHLCIFHA